MDDADWVSIKHAAEESGVSRRTIERWAASGRLARVNHARNRRIRLVHLPTVLELSAELKGRPETEVIASAQSFAASEVQANVESIRSRFQETIDETLRINYSHHHRLVTKLFPDAERPLNMESLRSGPLGRDLRTLAALASGETHEQKELVLERIETVLQLLFWPPMADDYTVPRSFWETPLGRMLSMAKYRAYEPSELVSIGTAAQKLGVTRPTLYRWMDERHLDYVRDEMTGRTFIVLRDVETLLNDSGPYSLPPADVRTTQMKPRA